MNPVAFVRLRLTPASGSDSNKSGNYDGIFCHNYYLNNLYDEVRFPDWPIAEPVDLFRACLDEFKNQLTRDESEEEVAMESTRKVLWLQTGDGSKELLTQSVQISGAKIPS